MNVIYKWLIAVVMVLLVLGGIYAKGRLDTKHKLELASVQSQLRLAQTIIEKEREARVADARLAQEAAQKAADLKLKVTNLQEYVDALADAGRECLSSADTERLRDIWN